MNVENFWKQLKHDFLHHLIHPRLDHLVWILCTKVVPVWMSRAEALEDDHRAGRSKALTTYQTYFKRAWKVLATAPVSSRTYETNVRTWQCNCGRQKYDTHALCKHLVQAVPHPPPHFWRVIIRRRTVPIYRHPALRDKRDPIDDTVPDSEYVDVDKGSVTDGDDHKWVGDTAVWAGDGGWRALDASIAAERLRGKRPAGREGSISSSRSSTPSAYCEELDAEETSAEEVCSTSPKPLTLLSH